MANHPQSTGLPGIKLIKHFEGLCLAKYQDAVSKWTIGYGHLILANEDFSQPLTEQQAEQLLLSDLKKSENGIKKMVTVDLNQNQFDALVSFAFNLGIGNLQQSTLLKLLNAGKHESAAEQFIRWDKAGGQTLPGLTRRRQAEQKLFCSPIA